MNHKQLLILLLTVCTTGHISAQLSSAALESAVREKKCAEIAADLEKTRLLSEAMKFNGAVCLYRNGDVERALTLFREVRQLEAQKQHLATFWEAKCQATLQRDSQALVCLQAIPAGVLHFRMLAHPEFERLAGNNEAFIRLKRSLEPGFNIWTAMLAVIAVSGLFIGFLLVFGKSRFSAGEKRLSVVVFSFALILITYILIWTGYHAFFPYLQNWWPFLTFLVGPSLYLYLKDTFKEEYTAREAALHYIVPAVSGLLSLPAFLSDFGAQTALVSDLNMIGSSPTLLTGHLLFYTVRIWAMTRNEWQVDANIMIWTKVVARGMGLYVLAFISYFVLVRCSFFNPEWDYAISFAMALGILAIAYMGLVQKRVFRSEPISHFLPVKKYKSSTLTENAGESIKRKMEQLLREEQVFKENELRLDDLAAYLNTGRHQLSQVINEHYGVNFFELINRYRIEHVKRLMADAAYNQHTIIQIAYEAGFNNKVSFNRYFKRETGVTPSAYRMMVQEKGWLN